MGWSSKLDRASQGWSSQSWRQDDADWLVASADRRQFCALNPHALGAALQGLEQMVVGSGEEGLQAEGLDLVEERAAAPRVQVGGDFVQQQDGRRGAPPSARQ